MDNICTQHQTPFKKLVPSEESFQVNSVIRCNGGVRLSASYKNGLITQWHNQGRQKKKRIVKKYDLFNEPGKWERTVIMNTTKWKMKLSLRLCAKNPIAMSKYTLNDMEHFFSYFLNSVFVKQLTSFGFSHWLFDILTNVITKWPINLVQRAWQHT